MLIYPIPQILSPYTLFKFLPIGKSYIYYPNPKLSRPYIKFFWGTVKTYV